VGKKPGMAVPGFRGTAPENPVQVEPHVPSRSWQMKIIFAVKPGPRTGISLIVILIAAAQLVLDGGHISGDLALLAGIAYGQLMGARPGASA
jgi:hypothetical protein